MKVYLGGVLSSCDNIRQSIIDKLDIEYYDPSIVDSDFQGYKKNQEAIENSDYILHVITPQMKGFQEIIDVVDDSNKKSYKTIYCFITESDGEQLSSHQIKSLVAIGEMVKKNGASWFESIEEAINFMNRKV